MVQFQLQVKNGFGNAAKQAVDIEAASESEAIRIAAQRGWHILSISAAAVPSQKHSFIRNKNFPLVSFSQELLTLLEAGLNLSEAVTTLDAKEFRAPVKSVLNAILTSLQHGKNFSDALTEFPHIFPDVYVATVRAAERSGNLPEALARFVGYQLQFDAIKKKLISAAIYPAMLLTVGALVTLFLLGYVVPKFSVVYESAGRDIPWMSQILLIAGKFIAHNQIVFFSGIAGSVIACSYVFINRKSRQVILERLLQFPVLSEKAAEFRLARFYRGLSLLLHAGIPLTKAITMVSTMLLQKQQEQLMHARRAVEEGLPFSVALEKHKLVTPIAKSLLRVGENTGRLGDMLERSAKFHDEEFSRWVDWFSRLLEPLLMTVMGIVIGAVVVLMYMPIFELAGSLS